MKMLVFDSGPLISLSLSGLLDVLEKLKSYLKETKFVITPYVKREVVDKALFIKKYSLEAFRIKKYLEEKVLLLSSEFVSDSELEKETSKVLSFSHNLLSVRGENLKLIQEGEASCIAFLKLSKEKCLIVSDERTVRLISESINALKSLSEQKLHMPVKLNKEFVYYFQNINFIRSTELVFYAFERGLIDIERTKESLEALLYSLKFHGASISSSEIEEAKKLFSEKIQIKN